MNSIKKSLALFTIFFFTTILAHCEKKNTANNRLTVVQKNQPYALLAGGSKGIGYAIAEALAKRQYNLILVARGIDSLERAQQLLESNFGVDVKIISKDLSRKSSAKELADYCTKNKLRVNFLANIAGLGGAKDFLQLPLEKLRYMTTLNIESVIALSLTMIPILEQNPPSYIMNVSSMAGFAPIPKKNLYSATKAAVIYFSQSLRYQLKHKNISVSCLCPGPVFTKPKIKETTYKNLGKPLGNLMTVSATRVGEQAVKKTLKGRMIIVPGTAPSISSFILRILPTRWAAFVYDRVG